MVDLGIIFVLLHRNTRRDPHKNCLAEIPNAGVSTRCMFGSTKEQLRFMNQFCHVRLKR